jgi:hypothetical protein
LDGVSERSVLGHGRSRSGVGGAVGERGKEYP